MSAHAQSVQAPNLPALEAIKNEHRRMARLLVVESDETVARLCLRALVDPRFEVRHVTSPYQMLVTLEAWRPQFLLIGDDFEDALGVEIVGQLRGKTNAPILLLTSTDSVGYITNCLEAGADDVMVRPIAPPLLLSKAHALMRRAYRYSVPPLAQRTVAPLTPVKPVSGAPVVPEAQAPNSNFHQWPRCAACHYIGPRPRFEGVDENGRPVVACPSCGNGNIRFAVG